jgi:sugar lactone lactonase YvrE
MRLYFLLVFSLMCLINALPQEIVLTVQWGSEAGQIGYEKWMDPAGEQVRGPSSFAVGSNGDIFILDSVNGRVVKLFGDGSFATQFGIDSTYPLNDIVVDSLGYLWVNNYIVEDNGEVVMNIYKFDSNGNLLLTLPNIPYGEIWRGGDSLYVVRGYDGDTDSYLVNKYDLQGNLLQTINLPTSETVEKVVVDREGNLYCWGKEYEEGGEIVDVICKYSPSGDFMGKVIISAADISDFLDVDEAGNFYMLASEEIVAVYSPQGELLKGINISISDGEMTRKLLRSPTGYIYTIFADPDIAPDTSITVWRYAL